MSTHATAAGELVRGIYAVFAGGDIGAVLGAMSADIEWNEAENFPYADGNPYRGPEAVLKGVFARCVGEWDGFAVEVAEIVATENTVVAFGRYRGTYKATGRAQHTQFAHVWWVRGGKVVRFQQHADTLHVARVIGSVP